MFNQPLLPCRGSAVQAAARGRAGRYEYSVVAKRLAYNEATPTRGATACVVLNIQQRIIF